MRPPDTFAALINRKLVVPSQKTPYLAVDRQFFAQILAEMVARIHVDAAYYLAHSPDVAQAIARGEFASAADHFVKVGFYEHRMPYDIEVDETWYLENYADIADAVKKGVFASGSAHFQLTGYREGRFPHAHFKLRTLT